MFIYSVKAGTIKFFGIVCVALVALIALIAFVPAYTGAVDTPNGGVTASGGDRAAVGEGSPVSYRYDKVKSADDAATFLGQFGWVVDAGSAETVEVTIPA